MIFSSNKRQYENSLILVLCQAWCYDGLWWINIVKLTNKVSVCLLRSTLNEGELNRIPLEGRDENTLALCIRGIVSDLEESQEKTQWCEQTDGWRGDGRCTDGRERRNLSAIHSLPLSPVKKHLVPWMRCLSAPIQEQNTPNTHTHT